MKLEDQVVSLELAKKLKALGVKQESAFYWCFYYSDEIILEYGTPEIVGWINSNRGEDGSLDRAASAFTVAELGEVLPVSLNEKGYLESKVYSKNLSTGKHERCWTVSYWPIDQSRPSISIQGENEADARAKMLIHLIEKGIVKP